jgi:hypothetical protein
MTGRSVPAKGIETIALLALLSWTVLAAATARPSQPQ